MTCRHHLLCDVTTQGGIVAKPATAKGLPPIEMVPESAAYKEFEQVVLTTLPTMEETCSLDVADRGEQKIRTIARLTGISVGLLRIIIDRAKGKMRKKRKLREEYEP